MTNRLLLLFILAAGCISVSSFVRETPNGKKKKIINTVVIDPGHGGSDAGAKGQYSTEKEICLAVSLKLGAMIKNEFPDLNILYTHPVSQGCASGRHHMGETRQLAAQRPCRGL